MSTFTKEEEERYSDMAMKHAHFLCDTVFKPAFEMAFIHGAKHMKEDMLNCGCAAEKAAQDQLDPTMTPAQVAKFRKKVAEL